MKARKVMMIGAMFCAAVACAETSETWTMNIVDEMRAMSQMAEKSNPWTSSRGGTWGVYKGTTAWTYGTYGSMVGFYDSSKLYFTFLANITPGNQNGPHGGSVKSGEVYFHPHDSSGGERLVHVLAESGRYSAQGVIRNSAAACTTAVSLYAGGELIATANSSVDGTPFEMTDVDLWAGETVELRFDCRGAINNDATGVKFSLSRTGENGGLFSSQASSALKLAVGGDTVVNPYEVEHRGVWSFLSRRSGTDSPMNSKWTDAKSASLVGVANASSGTPYPRLVVNKGGASVVPTDAAQSIAPDEMFVHPDNQVPVIIRFTAPRTGLYAYKVVARNLMTGGNVVVRTVNAGTELLSEGLSGTSYVTKTLEQSDVLVWKGSNLDFVVDPNGHHGSDATGLKVSLSMAEDRDQWQHSSLVDALREDMKSASPVATGFVSSDGGSWSFGHWGSGKGFLPSGFTAYDTVYVKNAFSGWRIGSGGSGTPYPYYLVNLDGAAAAVNDNGTVQPSEIAFHPANGTYGVSRFVAPRDGLYRMFGYVRSQNANEQGTGVDATVVVRGTAFATNGVACAKSGSIAKFPFDTGLVALRKDETLDLSVGPNGAFNFDASVLSAEVRREGGLPTDPIVSFDILGASRDACSGAGRIGLSSDGAWTALTVPSAAATVRSRPVTRDGRRLAVRLELSRMAGNLVAGMTASVPVPVSDGVVSSGTDDPISFRVTGLEPNAAYTFYAYSRNASKENGVFAVDGTEVAATDCWFVRTGGDWCAFTAVADGEGVVSGTFRGTADGAATFCALQVTGAEFPEGVVPGLMLIFR